MSIPKIERSIHTESTQPTSPNISQNGAEEPVSLFMEEDKVEKVKVNGESKDSHVGTDKFGREYHYLDNKDERLIPVSQKKKTFMTQDEFNRYVSKVTGSETLPPGVTAEFENGTLIFKLNGEKINPSDVKRLANSAIKRKKAAEEKAKQEQKEAFENELKEYLNIEYLPETLRITEKDGEFVIEEISTGNILSDEGLNKNPEIIEAQRAKAEKDRLIQQRNNEEEYYNDIIEEALTEKTIAKANDINRVNPKDIKKYGIKKITMEDGTEILACRWSGFKKCQPEWLLQQKYLLSAAEEMGLTIVYSDAERTVSESNKARKRKGNIVAPGGESPHNYGVAYDIVLYKDGKKVDEDSAIQKEFAKKAIEYSNGQITWGGDWKKEGEKHHFELSNWRKKYKSPDYLVGM